MIFWRIQKQKTVFTANKPATIQFSGIIRLLLLFALLIFPVSGYTSDIWTGQRIMDEVLKRHHLYPYVFEDQTMILIDRAGNRDVRKMRRFSRVEKNGTIKFLLVFDNPLEVRGVALLSIRHPSGRLEGGIYLPAFGKKLKSNTGEYSGSNFLGTDFAIEDLKVESLPDFRYMRAQDKNINQTIYFVVEVFPQDKNVEQSTGYSLRRHFIHPDNFCIVRTDYFDRRGRFFKRQTYRDLKRVTGDMWRPDMILMENLKERHKTLIKVDRRVFSHDYVPAKMFTKEWILNNRHIQSTERRLFQETSKPLSEDNDGQADKEHSDKKTDMVKNN